MSFREGLEAFLIIVVLLKFLDKTNNKNLKQYVWKGTFAGAVTSIILGLALMQISNHIGGVSATAKLWESLSSFIAVGLITTFIYWMITHGRQIKKHIETKATLNLSIKGIFLLSFLMIAREGAEIAIFSFAGKYSIAPIIYGVGLSAVIATLIHHSLIKVKLKTIFNITLAYLILQAGFLLGYSIHEALSALKELKIIDSSHAILNKAFNLSKTVLYHKEGVLGLPLYVLFGWYSKPEWIQFLTQYSYTFILFFYWFKRKS